MSYRESDLIRKIMRLHGTYLHQLDHLSIKRQTAYFRCSSSTEFNLGEVHLWMLIHEPGERKCQKISIVTLILQSMKNITVGQLNFTDFHCYGPSVEYDIH